MEEKPIKIIIENYYNQKITYTMSSKAKISTMINFSQSDLKIKSINVDVHDEDILMEKEDII